MLCVWRLVHVILLDARTKASTETPRPHHPLVAVACPSFLLPPSYGPNHTPQNHTHSHDDDNSKKKKSARPSPRRPGRPGLAPGPVSRLVSSPFPEPLLLLPTSRLASRPRPGAVHARRGRPRWGGTGGGPVFLDGERLGARSDGARPARDVQGGRAVQSGGHESQAGVGE